MTVQERISPRSGQAGVVQPGCGRTTKPGDVGSAARTVLIVWSILRRRRRVRQKSDRPGEARRAERHYEGGVRPGTFLWEKTGLGLWAHRCSVGKAYVILASGNRCDVCGLVCPEEVRRE